MKERRRRSVFIAVLTAIILGVITYGGLNSPTLPFESSNSAPADYSESEVASEVLERLEIKGRAPKTGYERSFFGDGWADIDGCDVRNQVLQRDLVPSLIDEKGCRVMQGQLRDPYTGKLISFQRGAGTSAQVQIDHVVALSDAWQKGAQQMSSDLRMQFANDSLNLLAVDGPINMKKGDSDSASWLPPNKSYRCQYVARQIAVKAKYHLWVTRAEHDAMQRVLSNCPSQRLPAEL